MSTLTLKVMHGLPCPDDDARHEHSLYAGLTAVSFYNQDDGSSYARVQWLDPVKTAEVPGYSEHEKIIQLSGNAYVMNEAGRTISAFTPGGVAKVFGGKTRLPAEILSELPHRLGAAIRRLAERRPENGDAAEVLEVLNLARIAEDA